MLISAASSDWLNLYCYNVERDLCREWRVAKSLYTECVCARWSSDSHESAAVTLTLDSHHHLLIVKATKDGKKSYHHINKLTLVTNGNKPKDTTKIKKYLNMSDEVIPEQCLSLYFDPWPWKELNFVLTSTQAATIWRDSLQSLRDKPIPIFSGGNPSSHNTVGSLDYWLRCQYIEIQRQNGGTVHAVMALGSFAGIRPWKAYKVLQNLVEPDLALKARVNEELHNISFEVFKALYFTHIAKQRPDIQQIYKAHCTSCDQTAAISLIHPKPQPLLKTASAGRRRSSIGMINFRGWHSASKRSKQVKEQEEADQLLETMSKEAFFKFLTVTQGSKVTEQEVDHIIRTYDLITEEEPVTSISLKGFTHYMLSREVAPPTKRGVVNQDMSKPLHDYFIASSHNTYLTGHQLHGESSVHMYTLVLNSGCRCVELDCWDGEGGEPIIYHGHTLTSKIKFKDVVETISKHAFSVSPYPLILSLENHCSIPQQVKMVRYMKAAFGDKLLTRPIRADREQLPSPEELKYKILIKNRKLTQPNLSEDSSHEPGLSKLDVGHQRKSLINFSPFSSPSRSPHIGGRFFSHRSSTNGLSPLPIAPYNFSPTLTTTPFTMSPSTTSTPPTPSPTLTCSPIMPTHLTPPLTSPNTSNTPSSPRTPTTPPMLTILEEADVCPLTSDLELCPLGFNMCEEQEFGETQGAIDANARRNSSKGVHFEIGSAVNDSLCTTGMSVEDCNTMILPESSSNYARSKSYPNSDLYSSSSDLQPHPPLFRTMSMDSVGLMAWLSSTRVDTNQVSLSDTKLSSTKQLYPEQKEARSHKPTSNFPSHIQRALRELTTPTRAKSPLVLHEHRSSTELSSSQQSSIQSQEEILLSASADSGALKRSLYSRRRKGSLGMSILQQFKRSSGDFESPIPSPSVTDHTPYHASSCTDTAEAMFQSKNIAKELSDLVVYTEPIKFSGFKHAEERRSTEMYSLSENVAKKVLKKTPLDFLSFNQGHMSRMYPAATRINSGNYNPSPFWMLGCQMVALNYQTDDTPMQQYMSVFSQNGSSGYILKPQTLTQNTQRYLREEELVTTAITLTLMSGQNLRGVDCNHLPTAEVEILGVPYDAAKVRCHASSVTGVCTVWSSGNVLQASVGAKEIAVLRFTVYADKNQDSVLYNRMVPLSMIAKGYQHLYFTTEEGISQLPPSSLMIHVLIDEGQLEPDVAQTNSSCQDQLLNNTEVQDHVTSGEDHVISGNGCGVDHVIDTEDHMINLEVCISEVEEHTISITASKGDTVGDLIQRAIDQVGLGGEMSDYIIIDTGNEDEVLMESCDPLPMEGRLKLENAPCNSQPQLAIVPILYSDLSGVDQEPITLFADSTTTAGELLSSTVARLGADVTTLCPQLKDRDDEEEVQQLFCFVLADQSNEGTLLREDVLDNKTLILPFFCETGHCLLLNIKSKVTPRVAQAPTSSTPSQPHSITSTVSQACTNNGSTPDCVNQTAPTEEDSYETNTLRRTLQHKVRPVSLVSASVDLFDGEIPEGASFVCHSSVDVGKDSQTGRDGYYTSTKIKPVSPEVAKHHIEEYYRKLFSRSQSQVKPKKRNSKKLSHSKRPIHNTLH